jgi:hypothetical protein
LARTTRQVEWRGRDEFDGDEEDGGEDDGSEYDGRYDASSTMASFLAWLAQLSECQKQREIGQFDVTSMMAMRRMGGGGGDRRNVTLSLPHGRR